MGRYILRYDRSPAAPEEHVQSILGIQGLHIVDRSQKMLLVDADESALREKIKDLHGWSIHAEQQYPLPDTRKKVG